MQNNAFSELTGDELANVVGGQEQQQPPPPPQNRQHDTIGVRVGDNTVGFEKDGQRTNYGMCMEAGLKQNWTPEQIKDTCGTPPP